MNQINLRDRTRKIFKNAKGVGTIILVNSEVSDPNFLYTTNLKGIFEGSILILKKKGSKLLTSILEYGDAKKLKPQGMKVIKLDSRKKALSILTKEVKEKRVGVNEEFMSYATYERIRKRYKPKKILGVSEAFAAARIVKDSYEIAQITKAAQITKRAMKEIQKHFKVGITERELARKLDRISEDLGSDGPSFPTVLSFGQNGTIAHHTPDNTKLKYGDLVLIDAGSQVNSYCSDISRTFIFGSDPAKIPDYAKKKEMIMITKAAQERAIKSIRPGAKAASIHNAIHDYVANAQGSKYKEGVFPHALGHSVGIEVHDGQGLWPNSKLVFKPNMVVAVEPGIYINGLGGVRIEDDVLVTKKGAVML